MHVARVLGNTRVQHLCAVLTDGLNVYSNCCSNHFYYGNQLMQFVLVVNPYVPL